MTLHELTRAFDNSTLIKIKALSVSSTLYDGMIYKYSDSIDKKYLDSAVCQCKIVDGKLDILLDE